MKPNALAMRHSGTFWNAKGCTSGTNNISDRARMSFCKAFGLEAHEQIAIEGFYDGLKRTNLKESQIVLDYSPSIPSTQYPLFVSDSLNYLLFNG